MVYASNFTFTLLLHQCCIKLYCIKVLHPLQTPPTIPTPIAMLLVSLQPQNTTYIKHYKYAWFPAP